MPIAHTVDQLSGQLCQACPTLDPYVGPVVIAITIHAICECLSLPSATQVVARLSGELAEAARAGARETVASRPSPSAVFHQRLMVRTELDICTARLVAQTVVRALAPSSSDPATALRSELDTLLAKSMKRPSRPADGLRCMQTWWQRCAPDERAYWRRKAHSRRPIDAWRAFQRNLTAPAYEMVTIDTPCPECDHPSIEALEFPDGRATYCLQCGYRGLAC